MVDPDIRKLRSTQLRDRRLKLITTIWWRGSMLNTAGAAYAPHGELAETRAAGLHFKSFRDFPSYPLKHIPLSGSHLWIAPTNSGTTNDLGIISWAELRMREVHRLNDKGIKALSKTGRWSDGQNLWIQRTRAGTKSWLFRYMKDGRERSMGLGPYPGIPLAKARERARQARELLLDGIDPLEHRAAQKAAVKLQAARAVTFKDAAERYMDANASAYRNEKHRQQWRNSLRDYAYPAIGSLSVSDIDTAAVLAAIEPIWLTKTETASRVRGRIESVLSWATVRGYRSGENGARWRGHLDQILPKRSKVAPVRHHSAMPYREVPAFMAQLRGHKDAISAAALEFTVLCAARTGETVGATWSELDLDTGLWTIGKERMKANRPHRVALSARCIEILRALPRVADAHGWVFPGARAGKPLSNMAMAMLLRDLSCNGYTVHGFRSSFKDLSSPHRVVHL